MSKHDDGFELYFQYLKRWEVILYIFYIVSVGASDLSVRLYEDKTDDYSFLSHNMSMLFHAIYIFQALHYCSRMLRWKNLLFIRCIISGI